jgi:hypothetical protein
VIPAPAIVSAMSGRHLRTTTAATLFLQTFSENAIPEIGYRGQILGSIIASIAQSAISATYGSRFQDHIERRFRGTPEPRKSAL